MSEVGVLGVPQDSMPGPQYVNCTLLCGVYGGVVWVCSVVLNAVYLRVFSTLGIVCVGGVVGWRVCGLGVNNTEY